MGSALFLAAIMTAFVLPEHAESAEDAQQGCEYTSLPLSFDSSSPNPRMCSILLFKLSFEIVSDPIKH
jgi:hypothetical protein